MKTDLISCLLISVSMRNDSKKKCAMRKHHQPSVLRASNPGPNKVGEGVFLKHRKNARQEVTPSRN